MKEFYSTAAERRLTLRAHGDRRRPGDGTPGSSRDRPPTFNRPSNFFAGPRSEL